MGLLKRLIEILTNKISRLKKTGLLIMDNLKMCLQIMRILVVVKCSISFFKITKFSIIPSYKTILKHYKNTCGRISFKYK